MNPTPTDRIDWRALITTALPSFLRCSLVIALLLAVTAPLRSLYDRFLLLRDADRYHVQHNGQVCHLLGILEDKDYRAMLRTLVEDKYPSAQGIHYRIEDVLPSGRVVDTFPEKLPNVPIAKPNASQGVLDTIQEGFPDRSSFRVFVPRDVYDTHLREVSFLVERYKLLTRTPIFLPTDR